MLTAKEDLVDTGSLILLTISTQRVCVGLPMAMVYLKLAQSPLLLAQSGQSRGYSQGIFCRGRPSLWSQSEETTLEFLNASQ